MKLSTCFLAFLGASIALVQLGYSLPPISLDRASCLHGQVWAGVHYSLKKGLTSSSESCVPGGLCNVSVSASDTIGMKLAISCCAQGDKCDPPMPPLPEEDSKLDGLTCETCRTGPYGLCKNKGLVEMSECETIKEPCMMVESLAIRDSTTYTFASDCGTNSTGNYRGNGTSARKMDEPFRQCIKIACNRTSDAATSSKSGTMTNPTDGSTSLQHSFLLTVICLLLLEVWL